MKYVSTRGASPELGFCDVLLAGLAPDAVRPTGTTGQTSGVSNVA